MSRKLRNLLCVVTGGHRMRGLVGVPGASAAVCMCERCSHQAVLDLSDLPGPRRTYAGAPERHRLSSPWERLRGC